MFKSLDLESHFNVTFTTRCKCNTKTIWWVSKLASIFLYGRCTRYSIFTILVNKRDRKKFWGSSQGHQGNLLPFKNIQKCQQSGALNVTNAQQEWLGFTNTLLQVYHDTQFKGSHANTLYLNPHFFVANLVQIRCWKINIFRVFQVFWINGRHGLMVIKFVVNEKILLTVNFVKCKVHNKFLEHLDGRQNVCTKFFQFEFFSLRKVSFIKKNMWWRCEHLKRCFQIVSCFYNLHYCHGF